MFILDFGSITILAYLMVGRLGIIESLLERLALSLLIALGMKSMILFGLIMLKIQPIIDIQTYTSLSFLLLVALFYRIKPKQNHTETLPQAPRSWQLSASVTILAILFAASVANALFFPLTETDAIWHQIQALQYFHETTFDTEKFHFFFPPYLNLLFTYFVSLDWERIKILFPVFYLCLLVIFYYRTQANTKNQKLAAVFTLLLGSTPYFWWHSTLPFLNLMAGVYFSSGLIYWFFCMRQIQENSSTPSPNIPWALLGGFLLGFASWTRLEFYIYGSFPLLALMSVLSRQTQLEQTQKNKILLSFFLPMSGLPSIWLLNISTFNSPIDLNIKGVMAVCILLWVLVAIFLLGTIKLHIDKKRFWILACGTATLYLIVLALKGPKSTPFVYGLLLGIYRTMAFNLYYSFSFFVVLLLFCKAFNMLTHTEKILGVFLLFYLAAHYGIYTFTEPKWDNITTYLDATFFHPGYVVNASPTREKLALYPLLIFFISCLPHVKKSFEDNV